VVLLRRSYQPGQEVLVPSRTATTDDRGAYRLALLLPDTYIVFVPSVVNATPASTVALIEGPIAAADRQALVQRLQHSGAQAGTTGFPYAGQMVHVDHATRTVTSPGINSASSKSVSATVWPSSPLSIRIALNVAMPIPIALITPDKHGPGDGAMQPADQTDASAACPTGFSIIGRLIRAEAMPKKMVSHQTIS